MSFSLLEELRRWRIFDLGMTNTVNTQLALVTCDLANHPVLVSLIALELNQIKSLIEIALTWFLILAVMLLHSLQIQMMWSHLAVLLDTLWTECLQSLAVYQGGK